MRLTTTLPRWLPVALLATLPAACTDLAPLTPAPQLPDTPAATTREVTCTADVRAGRVSCGDAQPGSANGIAGDVLTRQGTDVQVTSSNVSYDSVAQRFRFDVTVRNLLPEAIGTRDGSTADSAGINVFFVREPAATTGAGTIAVRGDGVGAFSASGQPYFRYSAVLDSGEVSAARTWELDIPKSVQNFSFGIAVSAAVQPLVVINELMANTNDGTNVTPDSTAEYVELYNRGTRPANLRGFSVRDNGSVTETINRDLIIPAGGYLVFGRSANKAKNGGITPDYVYAVGTASTNLTFSNSGADRFVLKAPTGVTIDSVAYSSTSVAAKSGVSRELKNPALDNTLVDGPNWQDATATYQETPLNKGTPGAANGGTFTPPPTTPAGTAATVTVTPATATIAPGATQQFTATARDSAGTATTATFTWTTSNSSVVSVNGTGLATGVADGTAYVIVTLPNGKADSSTVTVATSTNGAIYRNHLEFGTPTDATPSDEIILTKPQYVVGYSARRGGPAWISWDLNRTHFGGAQRCDCFSPDPQLPDSVYKVVTGDYTGSGYSRGHMVQSEQRTVDGTENRQTFLMTNILPQIQDMNGGPWLQFENYSNDLARTSNKEVYNIAGGIYSANPATLNGAGKVQIPTSTWKVIVVLPYGQGLANVSSASDIQVYAVNMPNQSGIQSNPWTMYRVSVDAIEAATGFDLLSALPDNIEAAVEAATN